MRPQGRDWAWAAGTLFAVMALAAPGAPSANAQEELTVKQPGNYIDGAVPLTLFRLRFDAGYDDNTPDRAEFFYAQYHQQVFTPVATAADASGRQRGRGGSNGGGGGSPGGPPPAFVRGGGGATVTEQNGQFLIYSAGAQGLAQAETRIDYQDLSGYLEGALTERFSVFVEVPWRFLNPEINPDTSGIADMNAGFKYAFWYTPDQVATFQLRAYAPTGDAAEGLGNNHVSLEPALLYYQRLTDNVCVMGEFRDWIPIGGTDFEGNIIRYGAGVSCRVWQRDNFSLTPVAELVGWTALGGKVTEPLGDNVFEVKDATGSTIVNLKIGARLGLGPRSDLGVSYGRALTGDVWYKDLLRAEYRIAF